MSSADVLSPPTTHAAEAGSLPIGQELHEVAAVFGAQLCGDASKKHSAPSSWRQEAAKANVSKRHDAHCAHCCTCMCIQHLRSAYLHSASLRPCMHAHDPPTQVGITSLLDQKTEAMDVVALDNYVQPIDRGPSAAEAQKLMRSWQYAVTGKVAAAAALAELKAEHIKHGGCNMLRWSEQTPGLLRWHA